MALKNSPTKCATSFQDILDQAGDDDEVYESLVSEVFSVFNSELSVSITTGFDWTDPNEPIMGEVFAQKVNYVLYSNIFFCKVYLV